MQRSSSYSSVTVVAISIFFICFFLNQGQQLFFTVFGRNLVPFSLIGVSILVISLAALFGLSRSGRGVVLHELFLFLYALALVCLGLLSGSALHFLILDFWILALMVLCLIIGRTHAWVSSIEVPVFLVFYVGLTLIAIGTQFTRLYLSDIDFVPQEGARTTYQLGYDFLMFVEIWPFLLLPLFFSQSKLRRILSGVGLVSYIIVILYFEKRAPLARAILTIFISYIAVYGVNLRLLRLVAFCSFFVFMLPFLLSDPWSIVDRFNSIDSSRGNEVALMFSTLSVNELMIGKGLGGSFYVPGMEASYVTSVVSDAGSLGRVVLHVGAAVPILKGGLIFFVFLGTLYAKLLLHGIMSRSPPERCMAAIVVVWVIFRFVEGPPTTGTPFEALLMFLILGSLSRRQKI